LGEVLEIMSDPERQVSMRNIAPLPWEPEFIRSLGVVPCPYHRYFYKTSDILEKQLEEFKTGTTRAEVVQKLENELFDLY
ncbi:6-phospho-beta-glucosidase, partial [Planococcus sp. SIMBA_143]